MPTRRSLKDTQPRKSNVVFRAKEKPASSTEEPASVATASDEAPDRVSGDKASDDKAPGDKAPGDKSATRKRSIRSARNARSARGAQKQKRSAARIALAVAGGIFVAFVAVCIAFSFDRWYAHDDAQDIQGTWYIYGTDVSIPISQDTIGLSDDAEYRYTIDTQAKTITYSIGNLSGTSHYRFSSDRSCVALIEDGKKVFTATLFDDISWWFASLGTALSGEVVLPGPQQSNVVMLTRAPYAEQIQSENEVTEGAESSVAPDEEEAAVDASESAGTMGEGVSDGSASGESASDAGAAGKDASSGASSDDMGSNAPINDAGVGAGASAQVGGSAAAAQ